MVPYCFKKLFRYASKFTIVMCLFFNLIYSFPSPSSTRSERGDKTTDSIPCSNKHDPFLWRIKRPDTDKFSYLFGTIHVQYTRVLDFIPRVVFDCLKESDNAYFELDFFDPNYSSNVENCQLLPNGTKLSNILPRGIFERVVNHLKYIKQSIQLWIPQNDDRYHLINAENIYRAITYKWTEKYPFWTYNMIEQSTESDIKSHGTQTLDVYLASEASRLGKKIGAVEDIKEQCKLLNDLSLDQAIFALNVTLRQHEQARRGDSKGVQTSEDMIMKYRCGDNGTILNGTDYVASLIQHDNSDLKSPEEIEMNRKMREYFEQKFMIERNRKMANKISTLLKSQPSKIFFFAFGVGHFFGNDSIIDILTHRGYKIERKSAIKDETDNSSSRSKTLSFSRVNLFRRHEKLAMEAELEDLSLSRTQNRSSQKKYEPIYFGINTNQTQTIKFPSHFLSSNFNQPIIVFPIEKISSIEGLNSSKNYSGQFFLTFLSLLIPVLLPDFFDEFAGL